MERKMKMELDKRTITFGESFCKELKWYTLRRGSLFERPLKDRIAKIEVLEEEREIPADPMTLFMTDGGIKVRIAKPGELLKNGEEILKKSLFEENYVPLTDENGEKVDNMYVNCSVLKTVVAIQNPFKMTLIEKSDNGCIISKHGPECYIVVEPKRLHGFFYTVTFMEKEEFERKYEKSDREIIMSEFR